jgi:hypothetical protein
MNNKTEKEMLAAIDSGDFGTFQNIMTEFAKEQVGGMVIFSEDHICYKCNSLCSTKGKMCVHKGFGVFECSECDPAANAFADLTVVLRPATKSKKTATKKTKKTAKKQSKKR